MHIRSIREMPAGQDEELATIFREMRRASGVSMEQMAGRLATPVETIEALEKGALFALPEWDELNRIITTYAAQLGLDARPILRRLEGQIGPARSPAPAPAAKPTPAASPPPQPAPRPQPQVQPGPPVPPSAGPRAAPGPKPAPKAPPPPPQPPRPPGAGPAAGDARVEQSPPPGPDASFEGDASFEVDGEVPRETTPRTEVISRARNFFKGLVNWLILVAFVGALAVGLYFAARNPGAVWSAFDKMPEPIPRLVRSAWELVRPINRPNPAPPVSDPDNKKTDKLP